MIPEVAAVREIDWENRTRGEGMEETRRDVGEKSNREKRNHARRGKDRDGEREEALVYADGGNRETVTEQR